MVNVGRSIQEGKTVANRIRVACVLGKSEELSSVELLRTKDYKDAGMWVDVYVHENWKAILEGGPYDVIAIFTDGAPPAHLRKESLEGFLTGLVTAAEIHKHFPNHPPMVVMAPESVLAAFPRKIRKLAGDAGEPTIIQEGPKDIATIRRVATQTNTSRRGPISQEEVNEFKKDLDSSDVPFL